MSLHHPTDGGGTQLYMAPQTSIPPAANVLGLIGTVCWCVQLFPQIWRNYRTKSTEGLPHSMMFVWSFSAVPFFVYAVVQNFNLPIQVQPQCFCVLCLATWAQCMIYSERWRVWTTILVSTAILILYAGLEVALVLVIRGPYSRGIAWPVLSIGIIAFFLLVAGYLPIPFELLKRRGRVVGIDFLFLAIDWCGAFFSLMALATQFSFDALFGTMYALCAAIELSIFISQGIWLLRTRKLRGRAKAAGLTFDEFPEAMEWQQGGWKINRKWMGGDKEDDAKTAEEASDLEAPAILDDGHAGHNRNIPVAGVESEQS